jgi:hypothetical protein
MATYTSVPGHIRVGAGTLWWAPLGTSEPALTTTAGKLATVTGVSGWVNIGATDNGSTFARQVSTGDVVPEENFYPELIATTGITESVSFALLYMSPDNFLLTMNGGTTSTAGSAGTALTTYTPPVPGAEVNRMLIWQSADDSERMIWRAVFNAGQVSWCGRRPRTRRCSPWSSVSCSPLRVRRGPVTPLTLFSALRVRVPDGETRSD